MAANAQPPAASTTPAPAAAHQNEAGHSFCPLPLQPPHPMHSALSHPLHWPFRTWAQALLRRPVELLAVATALLLVIGSTLLFWAERDVAAHRVPEGMIAIRSWWDALWLCLTSATTDSYGDVAPHTPLGRLVSICIAFAGIILVGSFTAAITSYIIREPDHDSAKLEEVRLRLERIELLLAERE